MVVLVAVLLMVKRGKGEEEEEEGDEEMLPGEEEPAGPEMAGPPADEKMYSDEEAPPEEEDTYRIAGAFPTPVEARVTVPEKRVRLQDRSHLTADLDLHYPLYLGGARPAVMDQVAAGVEAARQAHRRSQLAVVRDTRRYCYGAILAHRLLRLAEEALARLEVTLELTRGLYETSTGRVTKADYLEHKSARH